MSAVKWKVVVQSWPIHATYRFVILLTVTMTTRHCLTLGLVLGALQYRQMYLVSYLKTTEILLNSVSCSIVSSSQHHIKYQHLLKKKYVCDHPSCGRLFRLQKQLLRHAKHHTGYFLLMDVYACMLIFWPASNHPHTHTKPTHVSRCFSDQRDYICEYCARAFKSSHNLAVHRMIHTGEKPIQCV